MKEILVDPVTKEYTFREELHGRKTISVRPPRYSPLDKYAKYRRIGKEQESQS